MFVQAMPYFSAPSVMKKKVYRRCHLVDAAQLVLSGQAELRNSGLNDLSEFSVIQLLFLLNLWLGHGVLS
jgi:hypothetical protein